MEETGCVNMKFIIFLKATLGKMAATKCLDQDFINLKFWQNWPRKFYNVKSYDSTKDVFEIDNESLGSGGTDEENDDDHDVDAGAPDPPSSPHRPSPAPRPPHADEPRQEITIEQNVLN